MQCQSTLSCAAATLVLPACLPLTARPLTSPVSLRGTFSGADQPGGNAIWAAKWCEGKGKNETAVSLY